ncbi:MAG: ribokinase [Anaerolineae bacterium]|nr:MAG: ribokinase [Anaerolineae bacterium]
MYNVHMPSLVSLEAIDYLVIGHVTQDLTPHGSRLGGTAAYAARTARALGLRVGVVTACREDLALDALGEIPVVVVPSEHNTTFENVYTPQGRRQRLVHRAAPIPWEVVPEAWRHAPIIHLGPVAREVEAVLPSGFSPSLLGLTPQGWLRAWDEAGQVTPAPWPEAERALRQAGATVLSIEDVAGDEAQIEAMSLAARILVVTEGAAGARLYWNGDLRRFPAPRMDERDATGAGDIFAAAFFIRLYTTRDPWEAARFATHLAACSVRREGLDGTPTHDEIQACLVEVF